MANTVKVRIEYHEEHGTGYREYYFCDVGPDTIITEYYDENQLQEISVKDYDRINKVISEYDSIQNEMEEIMNRKESKWK